MGQSLKATTNSMKQSEPPAIAASQRRPGREGTPLQGDTMEATPS